MTDRELLARYAADGSPEAFAEMVRRHAGLVYSACRRVVGNAHEAEDVAQAAFLVLLRKGRNLPPQTVLAAWLHRTASLAARNAERTRYRRMRHERVAGRMTPGAAEPASAWEDLAPRLDDALALLPRPCRDAIVLRYLRGMPRAEVATELGCPEGTVQTRLHRGLERLRGLLARRGVAVSAAALATLLSERAVEAAPADLPGSITAACLNQAAPSAAALSIASAHLRSLLRSQVRNAAAVLTMAAALAVSIPAATGAFRGKPAAGYLVRPVYFLGLDEVEPANARPKLQTAWILIRRFFAEEMRRNGYGYREFNLEMESSGRPRIDVVRGREPIAHYIGHPDRIQTELEALYEPGRSVIAVSSRTRGWAIRRPDTPGMRGSFCCVGDLLPWLSETEAGQTAIFADRRRVRDAGDPAQRSMPGLSADDTIGNTASHELGAMMKALALAFCLPPTSDPLDVQNLGYLGAANYLAGRRVVWNDPPVLSKGPALLLSNNAYFRKDVSYNDSTAPVIEDMDIPLIPAGEPVRLRAEVSDGESGLALLWAGSLDGAGRPAQVADLRGRGKRATCELSLAPAAPLAPGMHLASVQVWDAVSNRTETQTWFRVVSAPVPVPSPPELDPSETVYVEDALPPGTTGVEGAWMWNSAYKASGRKGIVHLTIADQTTRMSFLRSPRTLEIEANDVLTAYVYLPPGPGPRTISVRWFKSPWGWSTAAYWGADRIVSWDGPPHARVRMGDLPPAGQWARLQVPASALGLEGKTVSGLGLAVFGGGEVFWDRFGKRAGPQEPGASAAPAPVPTDGKPGEGTPIRRPPPPPTRAAPARTRRRAGPPRSPGSTPR